MKVAILAGGMGTRLSEETALRPKPLVEIGGRPILWHIMKHYDAYGFHDFAIALGYKSEMIKQYFLALTMQDCNVTFQTKAGISGVHDDMRPDWNVDLIETGLNTNTGGRIKRLEPYVGGETFLLTWGDGVSNVDLHKLIEFHRSHGKLATLTAVRPPARFGCLDMDPDGTVHEFKEKAAEQVGYINGAFFVLEPEIFNYIEGDDTQWEHEPLEALAREGQLMAYRHDAFWQCMDTIRDRRHLERLWATGDAPWQTWERSDESSCHR